MTTLAIIDYGMGNLNSVAKAFAHVAPTLDIRITADAREIERADRVVLPGQAAMPDTMAAMNATGMTAATLAAIKSGKPFFGVCLGLQMLFDHSEEGDCPALGVFPGLVQRFSSPLRDANNEVLKVPHMGWNAVHFSSNVPSAQISPPHPLWNGIAEGSAFYFAHSYFAVPENVSGVIGWAKYPAPFCVAYGHENIFAVQFHPEKSAAAGLQLLRNFVHWQP